MDREVNHLVRVLIVNQPLAEMHKMLNESRLVTLQRETLRDLNHHVKESASGYSPIYRSLEVLIRDSQENRCYDQVYTA